MIAIEVRNAVAFLDFIKNRQQQPAAEQSRQQKPETAREMYSRQAEQDRTSAKPMDRIAPDQLARLDAVKADLQKATQSLGHNAASNAPETADAATSPQPMAQKMGSQDKAAPALSPTSMQSGTRATEERAPAPSQDSQAKAQDKSQQRPKTIARPAPSWER